MKFIFALMMMFAFMHGSTATAQTPIFSPNKIVHRTVTIASGQTVSPAVDVGGYQVLAVTFPATMTGTTMTLQAATSLAGTYNPVYNAAGAVSYTIAGARALSLTSSDTHGLQFIKLVSGTAEGADRAIVLHLRATN